MDCKKFLRKKCLHVWSLLTRALTKKRDATTTIKSHVTFCIKFSLYVEYVGSLPLSLMFIVTRRSWSNGSHWIISILWLYWCDSGKWGYLWRWRCCWWLFLDTFCTQGILSFLLFPDTFRIQGNLSFLMFLDTFRVQGIFLLFLGVCNCIRTTIPSRPACRRPARA